MRSLWMLCFLLAALYVTMAQRLCSSNSCNSINCGTCNRQSIGCCQNCCPSSCNCISFDCDTCPGVSPCCQKCCQNSGITTQDKVSKQNITIHNHIHCNSSSHGWGSIMPNIVLPNITIFINQTPIVIHNNPTIQVEQRCGNVSLSNAGGPASLNGSYKGCYNQTVGGYPPSSFCCPVQRPGYCVPKQVPPFIQCMEPRSYVDCGAQCFAGYPTPTLPQCAPMWPYGRCQSPCAGSCSLGVYQPNCQQTPFWPHVSCNSGGFVGGGMYSGGYSRGGGYSGVGGYSGGGGYGGGYSGGYAGYLNGGQGGLGYGGGYGSPCSGSQCI